MLRYIIFILILTFSFSVNSNENLTVQQQLERLQREVSDLSKIIFSNDNNSIQSTQEDTVTNFSAIDIRIYDLEKDVKSLNLNLEDIIFKIDDIANQIEKFSLLFSEIDSKLAAINSSSIMQNNTDSDVANNTKNQLDTENENSLGSLKITSQNTIEENNFETSENSNEKKDLSPEDQFQLAFDYIRNKEWEQAKNSLEIFIEKNSNNQLSGSAYYWLGELYILEKKYRDAALFFAEGYQKFPESIKAPDMLFKLSLSLFEVNKKDEGCKTLEKLLLDFPKNKLATKTKKLISESGCLVEN